MAKITVGFKCEPEMKTELLLEASEVGISLSEYLESICANRLQSLDVGASDISDMDELEEHVERLSASLKEYEDRLDPLFRINQGETLTIKMPDGGTVQKQVNHPVDILEIILNAVKES